MLAAPRGLSQLHHVLHRLPTPRHPPEALISLTKSGVLLPRRRVSVLPFATSIQLSKIAGRRGQKRRTPEALCAKPPARAAAVSFSRSVEITGFEPVTPCVQSRCSTRLSYIPVAPKTRACGSNPSRGPRWWAQVDSNHRPSGYQPDALAN